MKLPKTVIVKDTVRLFLGKYSYKVSLICAGGAWFRGNNLDFVKTRLDLLKQQNFAPAWFKAKTPEDKQYCYDLYDAILTLDEYVIRVEHPIINFYTNSTKNVEKLCSLDSSRIKYISIPNKNNPDLTKGSVIVKKLDFDYKVYMGKTRQSYENFVAWSKNNKKLRLTPSAKKALCKKESWGGSYFYVKDDKTMTMVKMFLGSDIAKIESVIKA